MTDERVYLARTSHRRDIYHTNPECPCLSEKRVRRCLDALERVGWSECKWCADDIDHASVEQDHSHIRALRNAAGGPADD